ncbi:MarR family winged helix-turn-helix transcriptional regulator [Sphingosinicella sp. CPCC 101087]|uniref:MarR family winged helix-turn-helix transcriptional regulator n=1 Tax=Sphingosinicella sp. CPCC 101087 TaxID=2497754 RepID=UPI00101C9FFB|nr:MarR family winged helix-turn-helix transcriptional regulator [Sphingosinicella sp. CPCC 101087]
MLATEAENSSNIRQMPPAAAMREAPVRLGLRITMLQLAIYADLSPRLTRIGLTSPSRMTALLHINAHSGCSQSELAQFTGLSRTSAANMVEQLEQAGFVERRAGANARTNALFLTEAGRVAMDEAVEQSAVNERRIFGIFSEDERETLRRLLERAILHVEAMRSGERR